MLPVRQPFVVGNLFGLHDDYVLADCFPGLAELLLVSIYTYEEKRFTL
jgi:hypothetical protein